ncbi:MAG: hypothetical protein IKK85_06040 [Clostridia bacterium]|nr:hypothetical protein [Clostridia bacterium]
MNKLTDKSAYNISSCCGNKFFVNFTNNFAIMDINAPKNTFDFIYPQLKNCNNLFRSYDNSKSLLLNTTGQGFLFDEDSQEIIKSRISFGKEFYRQHFVSHKNGYYFVDKNDKIEWFDIATQKITKTDFFGNYFALFEDQNKNRAFFISIDDYGTEQNEYGKYLPVGYSLSIKSFSKKNEKFEDWSFALPKGTLEYFRHIFGALYMVVLQEEKKNAQALIHTRVYLFDLETKNLTFLFDVDDFYTLDNEGYFVNLEIDLNHKRAYILYSNVLKIINLENLEITSSVELKYASGLKIISDTLVIATWKGVFTFKLSEFETAKETVQQSASIRGRFYD